MRIFKHVIALGLATAAAASPASAGIIEFTFTGIVEGSPTDNIQVRQPGNVYVPYEGANAPAYPIAPGESVTVTFTGSTPDVNDPALPPGDADGIYRFPLSGPIFGTDPLGFNLTAVDVGGFGSAQGRGTQSFGAGGFDIVYNSRTGEYAIDMGSDGIYGFGGVDLPSFRYDPVADLFTPGRACGRDQASCPSPNASGTIDTLRFVAINMFDDNGDPTGFLGPLVLKGSFSLPTYAPPAQVDAPAAAPLFPGGLAILGWRIGRRRRR